MCYNVDEADLSEMVGANELSYTEMQEKSEGHWRHFEMFQICEPLQFANYLRLSTDKPCIYLWSAKSFMDKRYINALIMITVFIGKLFNISNLIFNNKLSATTHAQPRYQENGSSGQLFHSFQSSSALHSQALIKTQGLVHQCPLLPRWTYQKRSL